MVKVLLAVALCGAKAQDLGFENMFRDSLDEVDAVPLKFKGTLPSYMLGSFGQTGPARWTWGDRSMTHVLDGYSKLYKWEFKGESVLFTAKFLQSGFYKQSQKNNDIAPQVMAQPTSPPMKSGILGLPGFMHAPNDNNQVNVIELGEGNWEVLSDTLTLVEADKETADLTQEYNFMQCKHNVPERCTKTKNVTLPMGQMNAGASAHPFITEDGDYIGLREIAKYSAMEPGQEGFAIYRIRKDQRDTIEDIVTIKVPKTSYTHSFGLTKANGNIGEHAIVCQQPIYYNAMAIAMHGTLDKGLLTADDPSYFYVAEMKTGAITKLEAPETIFFGHQVNSYSAGDGKFVMDVNMQDGIFFDRYSLHVQRNKEKRDAWPTTLSNGRKPGYQTVTRYEIDINEKTVTSKPLFGRVSQENIFNEHDLFRLHPDDIGRPYCGYWAWQAYYNSTSFASWAVVRAEFCGEKPTVAAAWHRENVYPGEASFVPKPGSADKTEGSLVFHAYDGNTDKTLLVVADAKTMETLAEAELPVQIPFTVHGNWFPANSAIVI